MDAFLKIYSIHTCMCIYIDVCAYIGMYSGRCVCERACVCPFKHPAVNIVKCDMGERLLCIDLGLATS